MNTTFIVTGISFGGGIKLEEATGREMDYGRTKAYGKGVLRSFDRRDQTAVGKGRTIEDCTGKEEEAVWFLQFRTLEESKCRHAS